MRQSAISGFRDSDGIERALTLLGSALEAMAAAPAELVVVGGAALNVLGLGIRPTKDVDVVGLAATGAPGFCVSALPLPDALAASAQDVALALGLPAVWLNPGPTDLVQCGLPTGFASRVERRMYGARLAVLFAGRVDLIALKVLAATDQGPRSRHMQDLVALRPSTVELAFAANWARDQDSSVAFSEDLGALLRYVEAHSATKGEVDV